MPISTTHPSQMSNSQEQVITVDDKIYQVADLNNDAKMLVNAYQENRGLRGVKEVEMRHLAIAGEAIGENLRVILADVPFTEAPKKEEEA